MKAEIVAKLQALLEAPDPFKVQREFKLLSSQYRSLSVEKPEDDDSNDDSEDEDGGETTDATAQMVAKAQDDKKEDPVEVEPATEPQEAVIEKTAEAPLDHSEALSDGKEDPIDVVPATEPTSESPSDLSENSVDIEAAEGEDQAATAQKEVSSDESAATKEDIPAEESVIETLTEKTAPDSATPAETDAQTQKEDTPEEGNAIDEQYKAILAAWKIKIEKAKVEKQRIETETIATAKDLIEELTKLITTEENIGKAFLGFNAIRDKWKALPKVSNDDYRDLNAEYNKQIELFFYNINIYKELKELDLKHNFEEKTIVLGDQKKLLEENDVRLLEVEVRMNQDRWNDIGPTHQDQWDALKEEFWTVTREIYRKIQNFYNIRKEEQGKHVEAREALLEKARQISALELKNPKKWQEKTAEILEIQKEWNMVGFISKEVATPMWKEFRKVCDAFFNNKRAYYDEIKKIQDANKQAKQDLVEKAEKLKDDENWKDTAQAFTDLQKSWKEIGPAHQRDENKLWSKFREACDHFFQARKTNQSSANVEQKENLDKKLALIAKVNEVDSTDRKAMMDALKEISEQWRAIGHVPFRDKDKVNDGYKLAVDAKFDGINMDRKAKDKMRFQQRVEDLKGGDHGDRFLRKEQDILLSKISKIQSEVTLLENNMGFFASSKGADKFKVEIQRKIDKGREEIADLQDRMKTISST